MRISKKSGTLTDIAPMESPESVLPAKTYVRVVDGGIVLVVDGVMSVIHLSPRMGAKVATALLLAVQVAEEQEVIL